jgi:hypothetical protein
VLGAGPVSAAPEQPMGTNGVITRWTPVPANGHADYIYPDIAEYLDENNDVHRVVVVEIPGAARPFWCQEFYLGFWQGWVSC